LTIDSIRQHAVMCGWSATESEWTPLLDEALKALESAPEAADILRQWLKPPQQGATLTLPLSYPARHSFNALARLEELCKSKPKADAHELLLVRPVPTDEELERFRPSV